jgi:hypothetical protein
MTRYLIPQFIRTALNLGTGVEQFLGGFVVDDQPAIHWISLHKGADDDDFDDDEDEFEDEDAEGVEDDGVADEDLFVLSYYDACDEGNEDWIDVYEFTALSADQYAPVARHRLATLEEALALAVERYGADPARFVNGGVIQDEYYDYLLRGRR